MRSFRLRHWAVVTLFALLMVECASPKSAKASGRIGSKAWVGTYAGTLPCAQCPGIRMSVALTANRRYSAEWLILGKPEIYGRAEGPLLMHADGSFLVDSAGSHARWLKWEGTILREINKMGVYVPQEKLLEQSLRKVQPSLENQVWRMVRIEGGAGIPIWDAQRSQVLLQFNTNKSSVFVDGPCNRMQARSALRNDSLVVENIASTKKFCEYMDAENVMAKGLQTIQSYRISGDTLRITDQSQSVLVFRADHVH